MEKSLCLSIVSGGGIKTDTFSCVLACINKLPAKVHLILPVGGYAAQNRTMAVRMAMEKGDTHIMFIDSDMIFPIDGIAKLFGQDKDIIGANYNARQIPLISTVKLADKNGQLIKGSAKDFPKKTFMVAAVGTGFCLMNLKIFKSIPMPWFEAKFDGDFFTTEDVYFCQKAKRSGFDTYCDPTLVVQHIGDYRY